MQWRGLAASLGRFSLVTDMLGFVNNLVAEFVDIECALDSTQNDYVAFVLVIATPRQQAISPHCIQRTGYGRFGDPELGGEAAHRVWWRFQIDCQKHHQLPRREVAFVFEHHIMGYVMP